MRHRTRILAAALCACAAPSFAAEQPVIGAAPAWVQPAPAEVTLPPPDSNAVQVLLNDQQVRLSGDAVETYVDTRLRIQSPQGLQALGTIALSWQPDVDVITVHRLSVWRGAQARDLLSGGPGFTVLRREDMLEQATLTGMLTAILQPNDLQVGDILELAYTRRHVDAVVPDKPDMQFAWGNVPLQSVHFRAQWPAQMPVKWEMHDIKAPVRESTSGGIHSIAFELENPQPLMQPRGAPSRFAAVRRLQVTGFQSWNDVSSRFAPLYAKSAKLESGSPLRGEIERIRSGTADPRQRAAAALRLVQEQVRYVLLAMNEGALVPATADQTWQRRYGDCKAKTALLLALLDGLGIEAEPVAVSTAGGDGVERLLPAISAFNHVLVRATIGGKAYWLDGTRPQDRDLERIPVPFFSWGLPLTSRGSALVRIEPLPLREPEMVQEIDLDASAGADVPAAFRSTIVFRGDGALNLKLSLDNGNAAQRDEGLRNYWRRNYDGLQPTRVESSWDEARGEMTWTAEGTLPLDWDDNGWYEVENMRLGFKPDFSRPEGTDLDAPFAVSHPEYTLNRVRLKLPPGQAVTLDGEDIDQKLAGYEYRRTARLESGVLSAESWSRSLAAEISAKDAHAAEAGLRDMYKNALYLHRTQPAAKSARDELLSQAGSKLGSASEYKARARKLSNAGLYEQAASDLRRAAELAPKDAESHVGLAAMLERLGRTDEARTELETAARLDPRDPAATVMLGMLAMRQRRPRDAVTHFTAALRIKPDKAVRELRSAAYEATGELQAALTDLEAISEVDPSDGVIYARRAQVLMRMGRPQAVRALAEQVLAATNGPDDKLMIAGNLYATAGDKDKARGFFDDAIAKAPTTGAYVQRALLSLEDPDAATADLVKGFTLEPDSIDLTVEMMAGTEIGKGHHASLLRILDGLASAFPRNLEIKLDRGRVLALMHRDAEAKDAFAAVRSMAGRPADFNALCWSQAISGFALQEALVDCDKALATQPRQSAFLDSRGLVLLKLERNEDALAAYDAALASNSQLASSFMGRGIAKLRLGRKSEGEADIAAARELEEGIEARFAGFGVKR